MNPESTPHKVNTPYGVLYVAVMSVKEDSFHDSERGNVTELRPRIRVASDSAFEADPSGSDHWTIRGRAYAVHRTYWFHDMSHITYTNGGNAGRWHSEANPNHGGFRNSMRKPVEVRTPTRDLMEKAVENALDSFATAYPDWVKFSEYLYLTAKEDLARMRAVQAEKELAAAQTEEGSFARQANDVARTLPDSYFAPQD